MRTAEAAGGGMSEDSALEHMRWLCSMLAKDMFPNLPRMKVQWHTSSNPDIMGACFPASRLITVPRHLETLPRWKVCTILTHELAHQATRMSARRGPWCGLVSC